MPGSASERSASTRRAVLMANGVGAAAAAVFAAVGMARPDYVEADSSSNSLSEFWATSSALRTWAMTIPLLGELVLRRCPTPQLLIAAGLVQLGDSALGIRQRNPSMTLAPAAMGLVHLASARILSR